jgi:hypothetical protein
VTIPTPDRRYTVVDGVLQRATNPALSEADRLALVTELFEAKQAIKNAGDDYLAARDGRHRVEQALRALGERGPVWWNDGVPDLSGRPVEDTLYAEWWRSRGVPPAS